MDVLIAGAGPAGWMLANECARRGLRTAIVDPEPTRRWPAIYGGWADELAGLPEYAIAARPARIRVHQRRLQRDYVVLDNAGLARWLRHPDVRVITAAAGHVVRGRHGATLHCTDGRRIAAATVVDCTGARRALSGGPPRGRRAEQTALGLVLPATAAGADPDEATLMDWHPRPPATFCYRIPLGDELVLVEETSLARRPGLPYVVLAERLAERLPTAARGAAVREERVRIPLDIPAQRTGEVLAFGAAAGLVHPATGYSLTASLRAAPRVADAIARAPDPGSAVRAGRRALWSPRARTVHALRRYGLRALLRMPAPDIGAFFDTFFALPPALQRAYLSDREDVEGVGKAMTRVFLAAQPGVRRCLLAGAIPVTHSSGRVTSASFE